MNNARTIELARQHLRNGATGAYARIMSSAIRASLSARSSNAFRGAIAEDRAEGFFVGLDTACPVAVEG